MKESLWPRRVLARRSTSLSAALLLAGLPLLTCGCSSGGDSGGGELGSGFRLDGASLTDGQTWQINRPIRFAFNLPVDFSTVNPNTLHIADPGGQPAVGVFVSDPADPRVVVFQPRCPTAPDFSDAGLKPGGTQYTIRIQDQATGSGSIRSTTGMGVTLAQTLTFKTPDSPSPLDLFLDPVPGPPTPIPGSEGADGSVTGTRLVFADGSDPLPFQIDSTGVGMLPPPDGSDPGAPPRPAPLNLYSQIGTRTQVVVELNQPVLPTTTNISPLRIQFQFLNDGEWRPFPTRVDLLENCTATGSAVELTPVGVLPQNRIVRVWLGPEFEDLVGDRNILALTEFATMRTDLFTADGTPAGEPTDFADDFLETFLLGAQSPESFEDSQAVFSEPRAVWKDGKLSPAFAFDGTGGPGGNFDWHIAPNTTFTLDTTSTLIIGGPGGTPSASQLVVNGLVNIRNLVIPASSRLRIQGPNPARFLCSGNVTIDGVLSIDGNDAQPVFAPDMPNQPAPGALGNGGGGSGGVGSFLTNQVTPRGGAGRGAFGVSGLGGQGGESGWHPDGSNDGIFRRAAGGGGGSLGPPVIFTGMAGSDCPDQTVIGLDAESGFPGSVFANSAVRVGEVMPWGGRAGPVPFTDTLGSQDDFWGTLFVDFDGPSPSLITGELSTPWAGAGGGAGGDATRTSTYPPAQLIFTDQDKGAGGGGGAGSLTVLALGNIVLGPAGRIEAIGGHGSGGEITSGTNRIGGGSGGGSGGHIVLQTASRIDLGAVPVGTTAILARGGQGGAGAGDMGGAVTFETTAAMDSVHIGVTGPGDMSDNPYLDLVPTECLLTGIQVVRAAGGDGGPGIVQMHVPDLPGDVVYPGGDEANLETAVLPQPVGYDKATAAWVDQLIPLFGRFSRAQSKWIPLGGVVFKPDDEQALDPITFLFGGTDADGLVLATDEVVDDLPPLLAPTTQIQEPGLPSLDPENPRRLLMDATELVGADAIYRLNPALLSRFRLSADGNVFKVESAEILAGDVLALDVSSAGPVLPGSGSVQLIPRYFAIRTGPIEDSLPATATVKIDFQATTANSLGQPNEANAFPGDSAPTTEGWAPEIETLNFPANTSFRFFRFRIVFDLGTGGTPLTVDTARPDLEFLRVPFRF